MDCHVVHRALAAFLRMEENVAGTFLQRESWRRLRQEKV
jgi:hypothetical protein